MRMRHRRLGLISAFGVVMAWHIVGTAQTQRSTTVYPHFEVDPAWPALPNGWVLGPTPGVAVDKHDTVWIYNRPRLVAAAQKSHASPPLIALDTNGKFITAFGGPGEGHDWFEFEHDVYVDSHDIVWLDGSGPTGGGGEAYGPTGLDDYILKFDRNGKFLIQIGKKGASRGNKDTNNFNKPADIFVYPKTNEAFIADGYGNRRVIVIDAETGAFKRMWGAFGNPPEDEKPTSQPTSGAPAKPLETTGPGPQQFSGPVHAVRVSNDGLVYVGDRANRRIQVFKLDGTYVTQVFINREGLSDHSVAGIVFSPDPKQRFMYVADYGNSRLLILERETLAVLYQLALHCQIRSGGFR